MSLIKFDFISFSPSPSFFSHTFTFPSSLDQPLPVSAAGVWEGEREPGGADGALLQGAPGTSRLWKHQERCHARANVSLSALAPAVNISGACFFFFCCLPRPRKEMQFHCFIASLAQTQAGSVLCKILQRHLGETAVSSAGNLSALPTVMTLVSFSSRNPRTRCAFCCDK